MNNKPPTSTLLVSSEVVSTVAISLCVFQGLVSVNLELIGLVTHTFDEVYRCAAEVKEMLLPFSGGGWGVPLLSTEPGCPFPNFPTNAFEGENGWGC